MYKVDVTLRREMSGHVGLVTWFKYHNIQLQWPRQPLYTDNLLQIMSHSDHLNKWLRKEIMQQNINMCPLKFKTTPDTHIWLLQPARKKSIAMWQHRPLSTQEVLHIKFENSYINAWLGKEAMEHHINTYPLKIKHYSWVIYKVNETFRKEINSCSCKVGHFTRLTYNQIRVYKSYFNSWLA